MPQGEWGLETSSPTSRTSTHEFRAGGMIGAVHLRVTVQAILAEHVRRALSARQTRRSDRRERRMSRLGVTTLAKHGATRLEHAGMNRSVRCMTGRAVFGDRRVFPHERSALVGVTLEAGFVRRLVLEQCVAGAAMDVVTSRAGHFSGVDRMRKRAMLVHARDLVTRAADIGLCRRLEDGIMSRVTAVATAARNFID